MKKKTKTPKLPTNLNELRLMSENSTHVIGSLYDTKSEIFMAINLFRSTADFIRSIQIEAKNQNSMLHKFPADYDLVVVGDWHENDGISTTYQKRLGSVLDLCPLA